MPLTFYHHIYALVFNVFDCNIISKILFLFRFVYLKVWFQVQCYSPFMTQIINSNSHIVYITYMQMTYCCIFLSLLLIYIYRLTSFSELKLNPNKSNELFCGPEKDISTLQTRRFTQLSHQFLPVNKEWTMNLFQL